MINGNTLRDAIVSAAHVIASQKQKVDELNVFPVPDGDTGTNMSMTIGASVRELSRLRDPSVEETAKVAASALLRGGQGQLGGYPFPPLPRLLQRPLRQGGGGRRRPRRRALDRRRGGL